MLPKIMSLTPAFYGATAIRWPLRPEWSQPRQTRENLFWRVLIETFGHLRVFGCSTFPAAKFANHLLWAFRAGSNTMLTTQFGRQNRAVASLFFSTEKKSPRSASPFLSRGRDFTPKERVRLLT